MADIPQEYIAFAHELADAARAVIRPLFRTQVAVDVKADQSPVTIADREAERAMRERIMQRYPAHGIWGEEFGAHQKDAEFVWVLDPVDGTKSFIAGMATFGTLISLVHQDTPVLGLIDQPIQNERWFAVSGKAASFNGAPIKTRACNALANALLSTTSPHLFNEVDKKLFKQVRSAARTILYGYDCYAYAQLASGFIDVVMESGLKPHDFCAVLPVIEQAGGIMTDWNGKPLSLRSDGRVIACGDQTLHAQILSLINP